MCGKMSGADYYQTASMRKKTALTVLAAVFLMVTAGCIIQQRTREPFSCTKELFAMDTYMSFTAYGVRSEEAVDAVIEEIKRLDGLLSTGNASSEIFRLNKEGKQSVSDDTAEIFRKSLEIYEKTGGVFDFTVYPLMKLWGFSTKKYHVPAQEEIQELLPFVDASKVVFDGTEVSLAKGQSVDFGGIAKGYASEKAMDIFEEYGIDSGMVSLGGNVQVKNRKPDGNGWKIGIRNPDGAPDDMAAVVEVEDRAVITSGGYERYFEENGKTYIHILDPRTGYPACGGLASVSVVSEDGTLADALSTSLYIMGLQDAVSFWKKYKEDFDMVLITARGELYVTEGLSETIQAKQEIHVIE